MADNKHRKHEKREKNRKHLEDPPKCRLPSPERHKDHSKRKYKNIDEDRDKRLKLESYKSENRRKKRSPDQNRHHEKRKRGAPNDEKDTHRYRDDAYDKKNESDRSRHRTDRSRNEKSNWDDDQPRDNNRNNKNRKEHVRKREWDKGKYGETNLPEDNLQFGDEDAGNEKKEEALNKEEPNFALSGKLTEYTNTYNGVVIKYNEPAEARKPKTKWRFYPFKGDKALPMLKLHRQSAFLLGRDRKIADIPIDHPSCSSQHAVLQFRLVEYEKPDGMIGKKVKPYIIDLESTNGTFVNNSKVEARRYTELLEKDVLKFGFSSREYVILNEKSKADESDGDDEGLESGGFGNKDVQEEPEG